jgi:hypothetical protein
MLNTQTRGAINTNILSVNYRRDFKPEGWACGHDVLSFESLQDRGLARVVETASDYIGMIAE